MNSAFACTNLGRSYPLRLGLQRVHALKGVTLSCQKGWTLAIAGPNGSGKSTLLRVLAGVEPHDQGELEVLGGSPKDGAIAARIGYCPQEAPTQLELGFRESLRLAAALRGMKGTRATQRVDELLSQLNLTAQAKLRVSRGSGGMVRRFALALAFLHEPELIFLDEATAGLDAEGFQALDQLLRSAKAKGCTIVAASHLPTDWTGRADRLAVVLDGRIAATGQPDELLAGRDLLRLYGELRAKPTNYTGVQSS